jgi:crotonobetainyl-CoA:carnitine CoA-transferase CaiB-like acyl-CoA transferase
VALNGWNLTAESGHDGVAGKQVVAHLWPPDHGYCCADRRALVSIKNNDEGWARFLISLNRSDLLQDERFCTLESLRAHEWQLPGLLAPQTSRMTYDELRPLVEACGGELIPVLEPSEVLTHPQSRAQRLIGAVPGVVRLPIDVVTR